MNARVDHTDVGAYALGLLEDGDRLAFEAHLRGCGRCRAELAELSGAAGALRGLGSAAPAVPPAPAAPAGDGPEAGPPAAVIEMIRRERRAGRRPHRRAYAAGAAAAGVALAAGIGIGTALDGEEGTPAPAPTQAAPGRQFQGTDPGTGVSGKVALVDKRWGTQVDLELRGVKGPQRCRLEAVSRSGERSVVVGWRVPDGGYGVPGQPRPLVVQGGTALTQREITRFEVTLDGGGTLLSIPL